MITGETSLLLFLCFSGLVKRIVFSSWIVEFKLIILRNLKLIFYVILYNQLARKNRVSLYIYLLNFHFIYFTIVLVDEFLLRNFKRVLLKSYFLFSTKGSILIVKLLCIEHFY